MTDTVLCLHGRVQCGEIFSHRLSGLRKKLAALSPELELWCPDGPVELPLRPGEQLPMRGWSRSESRGACAAGRFDEAAAQLTEVAQADCRVGRVVGLIGFSEGASLVAALTRAGAFPELQWVVLAGAPDLAPAFWDPNGALVRVPSLHLMGDRDDLVPPDESARLACRFRNPVIRRHGAGHIFPSKPSELQHIVSFIEQHRTLPQSEPAVANSAFAASEELLEELEALPEIYPDVFELAPSGAGCSVTVSNSAGDFQVELVFAFTSEYPVAAAVGVAVGRTESCPPLLVAEVDRVATAAAAENEGCPAVFGVVQEVQSFLDDHEAVAAIFAQIRAKFVHDSEGPEHSAKLWGAAATGEQPACGDPAAAAIKGEGLGGKDEIEDFGDGEGGSGAVEVDDGTITDQQLSALTSAALAATRVAEQPPPDSVVGEPTESWNGQLRWKGGKGDRGRMHWGNFTVGLVGKPSAGKSTFFNACKTIGTAEAKVGAFPFTTIEPNIGRGSYRVEYPAVIQCSPEARSHGVEIFLKDVAGLVPGAYQGRGKGNRFLDDVCEADVLIHIVDGSGHVDEQGVGNGGGDPVSDIEWIYAEIHRWISDNVWAKWNNIRRILQNQHFAGKAKGANDAAWAKLAGLFSGYRSVPASVYAVAERAGLSLGYEPAANEGPILAEWQSVHVHRLVAHFLRARFPVLIGFNKCDDARSLAHLARVREAYLGEVVVPMSARAETVALQNTGGAPATLKSADAELLGRARSALQGATGVRDALDTAVRMQQPLVVYIVLPTLTAGSVVQLTPTDVVPLLFRAGSTAGDVFHHLHRSDITHQDHRMHLPGEFIRAEAVVVADDGKSVRVVLKKDAPLGPGQRVIKLYASRPRPIGKRSGGGGGAMSGGGGTGVGKQQEGMQKLKLESTGKSAHQLSTERMLKRLHKSSDRQGKSKGGKGTGQDRRTVAPKK